MAGFVSHPLGMHLRSVYDHKLKEFDWRCDKIDLYAIEILHLKP
jgi:hypothetical protein